MNKALVFDDDAATGRLVVRTAALAEIDAVAVTDAVAFKDHLQSFAPHIVILDLQLGQTDGIQQLRVLAENRFTGPVVLMSGYDARVLDSARSLALGMGLKVAAVLGKPLRIADLEGVLFGTRFTRQNIVAEDVLRAVEQDELSLELQPVVSRNPRRLTKCEALVRWEHPKAGRIPPGDFLPVAEARTDVMDAVTGWVIRAAADAYQVLRDVGITVPIAVNVSAQNLHDARLPDRIQELLSARSIPAHHLCIELTESAAFKDAAKTMEILSRIRLKGMKLSIDDFGTGYSCLQMLRRMPFTEIKIDQSFVTDLDVSRDSRAIVKSIIDLAENMEMGCVAEGVETESIAAMLDEFGRCDMQGYLIAPPMPVEAIAAWLSAWNGQELPRPRGIDPVGAAGLLPRRDAPETPADQADTAPRLSPRQSQVMRLLSNGCSVKEIARQLELGIGTVKMHLSQAYSALGARNRVEAVLKARRFLDVPPAAQAAE